MDESEELDEPIDALLESQRLIHHERNLVQAPTLPLPPPRDRYELDSFILAVGLTPVGEVDRIRSCIASFDNRYDVAQLLHAELSERPVGDIERFSMLLSITGELAHESSATVLWDITWESDAALGLQDDPGSNQGDCGWVMPVSGIVQARAAEMFVWVSGHRQESEVFRIISEHPLSPVRVATIDAFLYSKEDSDLAAATLRQVARPEDHSLIGIPRYTGDMDPQLFNERLRAAYLDYDAPPPEG